MGQRLDPESREVLEFRPEIQRLEPAVQPGAIEGRAPADTIEDVEARIDRVTKLANAVNLLAAATQARADIRAQDMVIKLDPAADASTIAAMRRKFPDADPFTITYTQYRQCKDSQRAKGEQLASQVLITPDEIEEARKTARAEQQKVNYRDVATTALYGTAAAGNGSLRPELVQRTQILQPINVPVFQDILIRILVNFIWKHFIKKTIITSSAPVGTAFELLPDEIAPLPQGFRVGDLIELGTPILGEELPKFMTDIPQVPASIDQARSQQDREKNQ